MGQILLAYGIPKETVAAITILYRNTKVKVWSPDGDTEYFDIVAGYNMLSKAALSTIFWVFGMTQPGIEPWSPGPLAKTGAQSQVKT